MQYFRPDGPDFVGDPLFFSCIDGVVQFDTIDLWELRQRIFPGT